MIEARFDPNFNGWRDEARRLLRQGHAPDQVQWTASASGQALSEQASLFSLDQNNGSALRPIANPSVPPAFVDLAQLVAAARVEDKWSLLYRLLYRLQTENSRLLEINVDPDVHRAFALKKSVSRDIHKMHAFVRFKKVMVGENEMYLAWHKPEHLIVELATPFFMRRFGDRPWSIFTPEASAHWDLHRLTFDEGLEQHQFEHRDQMDEIWKTYYKSIFNPARLKVKAMRAEMAPKYWSSLPEASLIQELIHSAPQRLQKMALNKNIQAEVDSTMDLPALAAQAKGCQACPLFASATQTVFGVGPENAEVMIVGEQPGDQEDLEGLPFVGPAGEVLAHALNQSGFTREGIYLTNAVKHFKWEARGKTRLHKRPTGSEMHACKPWLDAEISRVKPKVILALGVTAGTAILGRLPKIAQERGRIFSDSKLAPSIVLSWHPSAILRSTSEAEAAERRAQLIADLSMVKRLLD